MRPLVVIGDAFLDVDVEGSAHRLCPDAPVPVVDTERVWRRPGGAGLAALLAARDVSEVVLVTALGHDESGHALSTLLSADVEVLSLPLQGETVQKCRFRAHGQSLLRLDSGDGRVFEPRNGARDGLPRRIVDAVRSAGAVLVSDYGRGMTSHSGVRALLGEVATTVPVVWDPHPNGAAPVPGSRLVTPNHAEAQRFHEQRFHEQGLDEQGLTGDGTDSAAIAAVLRHRWNVGAVCVTVGADGALLADGSADPRTVPAAAPTAGRVVDACGAGDRFAAAATAALGEGATVGRAVQVAVDSATRFVSAGGAAGLSVETTSSERTVTDPDNTDSTAETRVPRMNEDAFALADHVRARGGRVVATGGCFDLLHPGHLRLLREAASFGDALVVCLNSDDSVRGLKGPGRPLLSDRDRAAMLAELSCVDGVIVFEDLDPIRTLERLRPDVWVKGGDYTEADLPERGTVQRHGGRVALVSPLPGYSTTQLAAAASRSNGGS